VQFAHLLTKVKFGLLPVGLDFPDYHRGCLVHQEKTCEQPEKVKKLNEEREHSSEAKLENAIQT